ncbi:hypothetical protein J3F83DRAFT_760328 [Trichoderma novae-zelandiae]
MCLPCFPWTWTEYEDPLDSMPEQHVWVHDGQAWSLQRYSPKASRRLRTGGEPLRQVHFQTPGSTTGIKAAATAFPASSSSSPAATFPFTSSTTTNSTTKPSTTATSAATPASAPASTGDSSSNQPDSFPQLGAPPHSSLGAGQWHTAADPTQSIKLPGQPFAGFAAPGLGPGLGASPFQLHPQLFGGPFSSPLHHHHLPAQLQPHASVPTAAPITYIGSHLAMADYQNAAPMPMGVNFQPPVPDTTFGPIPHVYVPRFDGGFMPAAVQVGLPSVQFQVVSAPATATATPTAAYTVVMPRTFYHNGYTFYATAQPSYVVAQQPAVVPQPFVGQQPVMIGGQPAAAAFPFQQAHAVPAMGMSGAGGMPVFAGNAGQIPDVSGLGRTHGEETVRQLQFAHANKLFEPQEFKPSDDDPSRFYYVREIDGNWTQRNRFTIDHLGDCRWYVTDEGWFYAVRMPN